MFCLSYSNVCLGEGSSISASTQTPLIKSLTIFVSGLGVGLGVGEGCGVGVGLGVGLGVGTGCGVGLGVGTIFSYGIGAGLRVSFKLLSVFEGEAFS